MKNLIKKISKLIPASEKEVKSNLKKYIGETVVIKYGGSAMVDPNLSNDFSINAYTKEMNFGF